MLSAALFAALIVVAHSDGSQVTLVDDRTLAVAGSVTVGERPHEIALSSDHRVAWVGNTSGSVTAVDLQHRRAARTIALADCRQPHDLRASRDHQTLWVACAPEKMVIELDAMSGRTRKRHDVKADGAWMLAVSPDESLLVTANLEGGSLSVIDRGAEARVIATARGEIALDVAPDGTIWSGNAETGAVVLWTREGRRINGVPGIRGPVRLKITPDGRRAVINDARAKAIVVVDPRTLEIAKRIALPAAAKVIALSPDAKRLAASAPEAKQLFIVDLERGTLERTIAIDGTPDGVVWADVPAMRPVHVTATLPVKDLVPEGIAYDSATKRFFVGSTWLRKIVAVDANGASRDFFTGDENVFGILGMRVDAKRRRLWVVHSHAGADMPMLRMNDADSGRSGVLELDADSGRVINRYELPERGSFLNDLAITRDGDVYITDTAKHAIYTIPRGGTLQRFVTLDGHQWPNGIDLTPDGKRLVVAVWSGSMITIELRDRSVRRLELPPRVAFRGADGLYVDGNSLIAVQPWIAGREVERYVVDRGFTRVIRAEPLVGSHPLLDQPTTGVIVGRRFHFIANSHLQTFRRLFVAREQATLDGMRELTILSVLL